MNINRTGHVQKSHINFADSDVKQKGGSSAENIDEPKAEFNKIRSLKAELRLNESEIAARQNLLSQIKTNVEAGNLSNRAAAESAANAILDS